MSFAVSQRYDGFSSRFFASEKQGTASRRTAAAHMLVFESNGLFEESKNPTSYNVRAILRGIACAAFRAT